jgi:hypothetical protein
VLRGRMQGERGYFEKKEKGRKATNDHSTPSHVPMQLPLPAVPRQPLLLLQESLMPFPLPPHHLPLAKLFNPPLLLLKRPVPLVAVIAVLRRTTCFVLPCEVEVVPRDVAREPGVYCPVLPPGLAITQV